MKIKAVIETTDIVLENDLEELINFVIKLEKQLGSMDFTEPLYQYFKKIVQEEDPEAL